MSLTVEQAYERGRAFCRKGSPRGPMRDPEIKAWAEDFEDVPTSDPEVEDRLDIWRSWIRGWDWEIFHFGQKEVDWKRLCITA